MPGDRAWHGRSALCGINFTFCGSQCVTCHLMCSIQFTFARAQVELTCVFFAHQSGFVSANFGASKTSKDTVRCLFRLVPEHTELLAYRRESICRKMAYSGNTAVPGHTRAWELHKTPGVHTGTWVLVFVLISYTCLNVLVYSTCQSELQCPVMSSYRSLCGVSIAQR